MEWGKRLQYTSIDEAEIHPLCDEAELIKMKHRIKLFNNEITCSVSDALATIIFKELSYFPIRTIDKQETRLTS